MDQNIICPNCKSMVPQGGLFCPVCGRRIASSYIHTDVIDAANTVSIQLAAGTDPLYLAQGTILQGKYRINHVIGQGGFGITYDGTDLKLQMHIAIKEYYPLQIAVRSSDGTKNVTCSSSHASEYEHGLRNFLREARNMAKFAGQENFVHVHDYFAENNTAYIIMEYVEGRNLKDCIRQHGPYSIEEARSIISPVLDALETIHGEGMLHMDISPSNIMILPNGKAKLLDFGAVREIPRETQVLTAMSAVYKKGYSPIEQLTLDMRQGTFTDIYALCATLYEMLTGSVPPSPFSRLSGDETLIPPSRRNVRITPAQERTLLKGLEIYGKDRIQTIGELRNGLLSQKTPDHPNNKLLPILLSAAAVMLGLILGVTLMKQKDTDASDHSSQPVAGAAASDTDDLAASTETPADSDVSPDPAPAANSAKASDKVSVDEPSDADAPVDDTETDSEDFAESSEEPAYVPDYPSDALSYNGHHYYIYSNDASSWEKAMLNCVERGGYLAVINDSDENEVLYQYVVDQGKDQAFFGLIYQDGEWNYLTGDSSDFRDWGYNSSNKKQPNNADENLFHVSLDTHMHDGHWSDNGFAKQTYRSDGHHYRDTRTYICEWDH